ncbi:rho GTPase-activating protein 20 isoform X4 [Oryctolagus cuniculus]|uniref:rho GTPase-activating protein 20 isoform X4 n=1 Tax=Oryctolagus cuniculus TaxID=9986 RepID=UPI0038798A5C
MESNAVRAFGSHLPVPSARDDDFQEAGASKDASASKGRVQRLLVYGPIKLRTGNKKTKHEAFLFKDVLKISNIRYSKNMYYKYVIPVNEIWISKCIVEEGDTSASRCLNIGWPMANYRAKFFSRTFMKKWERLLDRCITESKEKDQKQTTLLQIEVDPVSNIPYSGIITVTNLDTVNDVIHMALPVLGLSGSEVDYQMWVYSNQRKTSYPLIGHECPYAIQASYRRAALCNHELGKSTSTLSMEDPILEILSDGGIQFVLKPRHTAERQRHCGFPTNCLSCWGITRSHNDLPQDSPPAVSVPTFLRVSGVEDLSLTLWEVICIIKQEGPKTENIFQKVGDIKSFIALKERFNMGDRSDWGNESPLVLATLLKDFLRSFPGTLFSADLYDQWLNVLDKGNGKEARDIQRLLAHLPRANAVVLRHLFSSLYAISCNASYNQMTTSKLALCITPSLLCVWRSTSRSPALEGELRKKISLVEFMIANYPRIFRKHKKSKKSCMNSKRNFGESTRQVIDTSGQSAAALDTEPGTREPLPDVPTSRMTKRTEPDHDTEPGTREPLPDVPTSRMTKRTEPDHDTEPGTREPLPDVPTSRMTKRTEPDHDTEPGTREPLPDVPTSRVTKRTEPDHDTEPGTREPLPDVPTSRMTKRTEPDHDTEPGTREPLPDVPTSRMTKRTEPDHDTEPGTREPLPDVPTSRMTKRTEPDHDTEPGTREPLPDVPTSRMTKRTEPDHDTEPGTREPLPDVPTSRMTKRTEPDHDTEPGTREPLPDVPTSRMTKRTEPDHDTEPGTREPLPDVPTSRMTKRTEPDHDTEPGTREPLPDVPTSRMTKRTEPDHGRGPCVLCPLPLGARWVAGAP